MTRYLPLIVFGVMLNAAAQLALKQGMRNIGHFDFRLESCGRVLIAVATSPYILAGLGCYVISVAVWLLVLSRVEVSFALSTAFHRLYRYRCCRFVFFQRIHEHNTLGRYHGDLPGSLADYLDRIGKKFRYAACSGQEITTLLEGAE